MLDLYQATRDDLIAIILEQRATLADQERRLVAQERELAEMRRVITQLTTDLGARTAQARPDDDPPRGTPAAMPGLKSSEAAERAPQPRKARAQGASRTRMTATARVVHAVAACPDCGAPLAGGTVKRSREVIELPPPVVVVTEHVFLERRCPDCGRRCVPRPELAGVVSGQSRIGHRLVSLIAVLREEARLPVRTIQGLLQTLAGLHLSVGALVAAVARVAERARPILAEVTAAIRASPVVHADETGWREAGRNGYAWTFSTPEHRLFLRGSRAREMLTRGLGDAFAGVLVSDFYGVYTSYEGLHQYCWAHLLRDLHDLVERHPQEAPVRGWAEAVEAVFDRAQAATGPPALRWQARRQCEADLRTLCQPWLEPRAPQTTLCQRLLRHLAELFVFVTDPAVPATNNAAERSLRHLVVSRKISGGTRSPTGTQTKLTLASLFGTWRAQGINPFAACQNLLASPQL